MEATRSSSRAVFLILVLSLFFGAAGAYPQSAGFSSSFKLSNNWTNAGIWPAKCAESSMSALAVPHSASLGEPLLFGGGMDDANPSSLPEAACLALTAAPNRPVDVPCRSNITGAASSARVFPCAERVDTIPGELSALGKAGLKIERAREEALEILRSNNACSEWFEEKDANPAATFQSLNFEIDRHGGQDIFESRQGNSLLIFHQPYVARATQDGGPFTTITINANGAFYRSQGKVQRIMPEGGPPQIDGVRLLTVGSYPGDTLSVQLVTLLHELGHIIDLLPEDADDLDGRSVRNTSEVLRHCRAEIEARSREAKKTTRQ
jgi:hypothetical protein